MRRAAPLIGACLLLAVQTASAAPPIERQLHGRRAPRVDAVDADARARGLNRGGKARATGATGQYRAVVILLQFPDWPADTLNHTPAAYDSILFTVGTVPTGSLRDYYREVSRGAFDIDGVVTRWYTAPQPYSYYTNGKHGFGGWPNNAQQMAAHAVELADPDIDFRDFDNDGPDGIPGSGDDDGVVDGLFIVHAGPGNEETNLESDIQSHQWNLRLAVFPDGIIASDYTSEPEEWAGVFAGTSPGELISIGVFCHEYGHILGLPDLYDRLPEPTMSEGLGDWDLMATGVYNRMPGRAPGSTPSHFSAWSKIRLGWVEPTSLARDSLGVTIPPVETSGRVFRLWTNGLETGEYFLLENRQPVGFDSALVTSSILGGRGASRGLLIYHVDDAEPGNDDPARKLVDVEEAGGVETLSGFPEPQNLDIESGVLAPQENCGMTPNVTGNRGDEYDPWPGALDRPSFDSNSCPGSASYCGAGTQVAVLNIAESGPGPVSDIVADLHVRGVTVRRLAVLLDDSPSISPTNNGNGRAETGETVELRFPILNLDTDPTSSLYAKVRARDLFTGLYSDSIDYGVVPGADADSGVALQAGINAAPDPRSALYVIAIRSPVGLVEEDSVQILLGTRTGLCETFETTNQLWLGVPSRCGSLSEWRREAGVNHTPGGTWAWRLGPTDGAGSYAPYEDSRLVSQPIRLEGAGDTLVFWQRYDTSPNFDGVSVEASQDGGVTWTLLQPVGGYPSGDRWTGFQPTFKEAKVPLEGWAGITQIGFRFRSQQASSGLGWWIDDVRVTGDADCYTTAIAISRFDATPDPAAAGIRLDWRLTGGTGSRIAIDRASAGAAPVRIATLAGEVGDSYLDRDVASGAAYDYWLTASREGELAAVWGPVRAVAPAGAAPRALVLSPVRPNPFNPAAAVTVTLDRPGRFVLRVYRADGAAIRTLADAVGAPGVLRYLWDGTDDRGAGVGSGIYFIELRSGHRTRVQKAVLLR